MLTKFTSLITTLFTLLLWFLAACVGIDVVIGTDAVGTVVVFFLNLLDTLPDIILVAILSIAAEIAIAITDAIVMLEAGLAACFFVGDSQQHAFNTQLLVWTIMLFALIGWSALWSLLRWLCFFEHSPWPIIQQDRRGTLPFAACLLFAALLTATTQHAGPYAGPIDNHVQVVVLDRDANRQELVGSLYDPASSDLHYLIPTNVGLTRVWAECDGDPDQQFNRACTEPYAYWSLDLQRANLEGVRTDVLTGRQTRVSLPYQPAAVTLLPDDLRE